MKVFFNGQVVKDANIHLGIDNRQFLYGDGFFETMLAKNGNVKYFSAHIERISSALSALSITPPKDLTYLQNIISDLTNANKAAPFTIIKILVWRSSGGKYEPENDQGEMMVICKKSNAPEVMNRENAGFAEEIHNHFNSLSKFKSSSALNYVASGLEKRKRKLDEIIIFDDQGYVSECLYSNLYWVKENKIFTPSLETGCIEGVSRKVLIRNLKNQGSYIVEKKAAKEELLQADHIFTTNAVGIAHITRIAGRKFTPFHKIEELYRSY